MTVKVGSHAPHHRRGRAGDRTATRLDWEITIDVADFMFQRVETKETLLRVDLIFPSRTAIALGD